LHTVGLQDVPQDEVPHGLQADVAQGEHDGAKKVVCRQPPNKQSNKPHSAWLSDGLARSAAAMPQQSVMPRAIRVIIFLLQVKVNGGVAMCVRDALLRYSAAAENRQAINDSSAPFGEESVLLRL
jgi:hypothetical protein